MSESEQSSIGTNKGHQELIQSQHSQAPSITLYLVILISTSIYLTYEIFITTPIPILIGSIGLIQLSNILSLLKIQIQITRKRLLVSFILHLTIIAGLLYFIWDGWLSGVIFVCWYVSAWLLSLACRKQLKKGKSN